ncbi:hypothetical protein AH4AK4_3041 [Aeromonas hydrophila 4AK4]|nr:hypothetical protein AH4AK4_3041 [Aeromonas hydrophila 4AK4]
MQDTSTAASPPILAETRAYVARVKLLHQRYKEMLSARGL